MEDYSRDQLLSAITKHKTINAIKRNLGLKKKKKKEVVALFRKPLISLFENLILLFYLNILLLIRSSKKQLVSLH